MPDETLSDDKTLQSCIPERVFNCRKVFQKYQAAESEWMLLKKRLIICRGVLFSSSEEGKNTKIVISLPLTLAIIDGLLVKSG